MKKTLVLALFCLFALPAHAQDAEGYAYEDYPEYTAEDYQYDDAYPAADKTDTYEGGQPSDAQPPAPELAPAAETPAPAAEATTNAIPASEKEVYIPLFMGTAPNYTVDPAKPSLPANHPLLRLKGTLWRSDEVLLSTNGRGLVSARRMYLVFDAARSAVAFASAPYNAPTLSDYPPSSDYIELIPLLETNTYRASPYQSRYIEIPEKYYRPTPNPMMDANVPPPPPEAPLALPEEAAPAEITPPAAEPEVPEEMPAEIIKEPIGEEGYEEYTEEYTEYTEYAEEAPEYEAYSMLPLKYVAQNAAPEAPLTQAVVNIGGLEGGIFVDKSQNSSTPYLVLFLALEKDNTLSVYTIQNSFDIRLDTPEIIQARALYKKAFEVRANMKPFRRVDIAESPTTPLLKNFFK